MLFRAAQVCMFCGNHLGNTCYIARAMIAGGVVGVSIEWGAGRVTEDAGFEQKEEK